MYIPEASIMERGRGEKKTEKIFTLYTFARKKEEERVGHPSYTIL